VGCRKLTDAHAGHYMHYIAIKLCGSPVSTPHPHQPASCCSRKTCTLVCTAVSAVAIYASNKLSCPAAGWLPTFPPPAMSHCPHDYMPSRSREFTAARANYPCHTVLVRASPLRSKRPLLSVEMSVCLSVCLFVCLSVILSRVLAHSPTSG